MSWCKLTTSLSPRIMQTWRQTRFAWASRAKCAATNLDVGVAKVGVSSRVSAQLIVLAKIVSRTRQWEANERKVGWLSPRGLHRGCSAGALFEDLAACFPWTRSLAEPLAKYVGLLSEARTLHLKFLNPNKLGLESERKQEVSRARSWRISRANQYSAG